MHDRWRLFLLKATSDSTISTRGRCAPDRISINDYRHGTLSYKSMKMKHTLLVYF